MTCSLFTAPHFPLPPLSLPCVPYSPPLPSLLCLRSLCILICCLPQSENYSNVNYAGNSKSKAASEPVYGNVPKVRVWSCILAHNLNLNRIYSLALLQCPRPGGQCPRPGDSVSLGDNVSVLGAGMFTWQNWHNIARLMEELLPCFWRE